MNSGALSGVAGEPGCRTAHRDAARLAPFGRPSLAQKALKQKSIFSKSLKGQSHGSNVSHSFIVYPINKHKFRS